MKDLMKELDRLDRFNFDNQSILLRKRGKFVEFERVKTVVGQWITDQKAASTLPDFLVIGAFRYALGRQTYVTAETSQWLIAYWEALSHNARVVIARNLADAIREDDAARLEGDKHLPLGADMDRREWAKLGQKIEASKHLEAN